MDIGIFRLRLECLDGVKRLSSDSKKARIRHGEPGFNVFDKWELIDYNIPQIVSILNPTSSGLSTSN